MTVNLAEGGNCSFMEGINAIYPNIIVAMEPILPDSSESWKNIAKLNKANNRTGKKIVTNTLPGYLYRGMTKWVYWKYLTFLGGGFSYLSVVLINTDTLLQAVSALSLKMLSC